MEIKKLVNPEELNQLIKNYSSPWKQLSSETIFQNPWSKVEKNVYENGCIYSRMVKNDSVHILAITSDDQIILEARKYRPGTNQPMLELPAGYMEPNEDAIVSATRELAEETQIECSQLFALVPIFWRADDSNSMARGFIGRIKNYENIVVPFNEKFDERKEYDLISFPIKALVENLELFSAMCAPDQKFIIEAYYQWILNKKI
jgi:8-oxo-dGTP pyrophosphatase MutT (NUDIX family)